MPAVDLPKLVKLLNLSRSDQPNEAMGAIKRASEMVGYDWAGFFEGLSDKPRSGSSKNLDDDDDRPKKSPLTVDQIKNLLHWCRLKKPVMKKGQLKWFEIFEKSFAAHNSLSAKQVEILENIYIEIINR